MISDKDFILNIEAIQKIFFEYYDETKRITIASEEFGNLGYGLGSEEIFYNIFGILDQIYQLFNNPAESNLDNCLKIIRANFLIAQNYSIVIELSEFDKKINKFPTEQTKEISQIVHNVSGILKKYELATINEATNELRYDNLKNVKRTIDNLEKIQKVNAILKECFQKAINVYMPEWKIDKSKNLKIKQLDEQIYDKFQWLICSEYDAARWILFDVMTKLGGHFSFSLADLRDAIDHIARGLVYDKCDCIAEFNFAAEHIRRAAMETIQRYINDKTEIISNSLFSAQMSKNENEILIALINIKAKFCCARYNKATETWYSAIGHFYDILDDLEKIESYA